MRVFKSSITSTFGRRERGRVVEVVRARGFQSRHSSLLYNSTRRRVREREREREYFARENKRSRRRRNSAKTLPFELSFVGQSEEKKEAKCISKKSNLAVKKEKVCSPRTRLSLLHSFARARYTHTRFYRAVVILSRIHTRYERETTKTAKREGGRGVLFLWWFCASQRVKESALSAIFPNGFVVHVLWGKFS